MPDDRAASTIAEFLGAHSRTWTLAKATMQMFDKGRVGPTYQLVDAANLAVLYGAGDSFAQSRGFDLDDLHAGFELYFGRFDDGDRHMKALGIVCDVPELAGLIDDTFDTVRSILLEIEAPSTAYFRLAIPYEAALASLDAIAP